MVSALLIASLSVGILGGKIDKDHPDCVAVNLEGSWVSSGTLISPDVVVTAGYVFIEGEENGGIREVFLGPSVSGPGTKIRVKQAIRHPEYDPRTLANSLTVLILDQKVPEHVARPRPIAPRETIDKAPFVRVVGFGVAPPEPFEGFGVRRMVDLKIASFGKTPEERDRLGLNVETEFAAGGNGVDTCNGDGGGPAYVIDGRVPYIAGITSRAVRNARAPCGDGGVFVRLDVYRDYLLQVIRAAGGQPPPPPVGLGSRDARPGAAVGLLTGLVVESQAPQPGAAPRQRGRSRPVQTRALPAGAPTYNPENVLSEDRSFQDKQDRFQFTERRLGLRIRGGTIAGTLDHPDCVAVQQDGEWNGTGVLVTPDVVVTAGHLYIDGERNGAIEKVFIGKNVNQPGSGETVLVKQAVRHPNYDMNLIKNDLTVLILDRPVRGVPHVELASRQIIEGSPQIRIVGFGMINNDRTTYGRKRIAEVPIAIYDCPAAGPSSLMCKYGCNVNELVAADPEHGCDSCEGDSGGPSYIQSNGKWYLATITSRSILVNTVGGSACGRGGIYVRLDRYKDWIEQTARNNGGTWSSTATR
jgi:V8-like Glu-specific endopeptidase